MQSEAHGCCIEEDKLTESEVRSNLRWRGFRVRIPQLAGGTYGFLSLVLTKRQ